MPEQRKTVQLPRHVYDDIVTKVEAAFRNRFPSHRIRVSYCPYCGHIDLRVAELLPDGGVDVLGPVECDGCIVFRQKFPEIMEKVTRMFQFYLFMNHPESK